jgi:serine acetyltransferase
MWDRLRRPKTERMHRSPEEPAREPTPEQRAELERYFRDTAEGRAELAHYFEESPEGRDFLGRHLNATAQGRIDLERHFKTVAAGRARLQEHFRVSPSSETELRESIAAEVYRQQPRFCEALRADAAAYASLMLRPPQLKSGLALLREVVRLSFRKDAFICMLLYRLRVRLYVWGVPILPTVLHHVCVMLGQIDIGDHVLVEPGVYIPHGKVVMDGIVRVGRGTMLTPWVTLGLNTGIEGPTLGANVLVGTGAKILGPVQIGEAARIAANAVVLTDVPPRTTVAGAPAKIVRDRRSDSER